MSSAMAWPAHAVEAVQKLNDSIPAEWRLSRELLDQYPEGTDQRPLAEASGLLSSEELDLTDPAKDATYVLECIREGRFTAVTALTAFAKRAAIAQQALSCLSDWFFDEALVKAQALDALSSTGKTAGPLHGLPVSIKSQFHVTGRPSSAGYSNYVMADSTTLTVRILEEAGAIPFCKTNLPQAIMALECRSFWGHTKNPLNSALSPGGSSGGCAALVAFGGAPLSMGSDIGGSIRQPAACCGLWGPKCTTLRFPRDTGRRINIGFDSIVGTSGFLCRSLRDVELTHSLIINSEAWKQDPALTPLPWRRSETLTGRGNGSKLCIGFALDDGFVRPHPPIKRGLLALRAALEKTGQFEIVEYDPKDLHKRADALATSLYFPDGGQRARDMAKEAQEPFLPMTAWKTSRPEVKSRSVHELWDLNAAREALRLEFHAHWQEQNIDLLILPAQPQTAPQTETAKYWGFTSVFNVVDYPAMTFPTGLFVDPAKDVVEFDFVPLSEEDKYMHGIYDSQRYLNTPICLQAVTPRNQDERLIQIMELVNKVLPL